MSFLGFDSHGKSGEDDSQPPEPHHRGEAALSGETEACLEGRIVEHLAAAGRTVPTWAGLSELAHASPEGLAEGENAARVRRCGANLMLDHIGRMPGEAWQQRWEASGLEQVGPADFRQAVCAAAGFPATAGRLWQLTSGLGALMTVDVIRLSFGFLLGAVLNHTWSNLLAWRGDPHADILDRVPCTP